MSDAILALKGGLSGIRFSVFDRRAAQSSCTFLKGGSVR